MVYQFYNKQKNKKKFKLKIFIVIFIVILIIFYIYLRIVVNPLVIEASEAKVKAVAQLTMTNTVLSTLNSENIYDDLISYTYDDDNKIKFINVNSLLANQLSRKISEKAQIDINRTTASGIEIHLGAFTGLAVLATSGPLINFNLQPIGAIVVEFRSEFITAGINQTLHKIYINLNSVLHLILPTANPNITTKSEVLIAECIIVGDIPSTYLQSSYLDEMLNLVPV